MNISQLINSEKVLNQHFDEVLKQDSHLSAGEMAVSDIRAKQAELKDIAGKMKSMSKTSMIVGIISQLVEQLMVSLAQFESIQNNSTFQSLKKTVGPALDGLKKLLDGIQNFKKLKNGELTPQVAIDPNLNVSIR